MSDDRDEEVPRLPRGRSWLRPNGRELMTIAMLVVCLVAIIVLRQGCAEGVANMFRAMEPAAGDAGSAAPAPR